MSTIATTRHAAAKAARIATPRRQHAPNLTPLADEGIIVAVVAVTGTEDHVGDVIAPGAFAKTLKERRPKVCFNHSWADPLGRVLHIVELMPGDARLPKKLPDGRVWPRAAGAVIATMQFHMSTERGREMFAHAKEWAAAGEAAFSIGYKAVPGRTAKRADGVRVIYELQLFEVSLVLHGAHDMALALEVKDALSGDAPERETRTAPAGLTTVVEPDDQPDFTDSAMIALYPDAQTAAQIAVPGGLEASDLHVTVAFLGDAASIDVTPLLGQLAPALAGTGTLSGTVGGLGMFPEGENGVPVWAPVDVPGLDALRTAVVDALAAAGHPQQSEHGYTPHMTLGYGLDEVDPVEPVPVSFSEAVLVVGGEKHTLPLDPPPAPMEGKAANMVRSARAEWVMSNVEHVTAAMSVIEAKSLPTAQETKSMHTLTGSFEDLRDKLSRAVDDLFAPPRKDSGSGPEPSCYAYIEATFPDYVVVTVNDHSKPADQQRTTYVVTYTAVGDGIELGEPEEARIEVTLADAPADEDGDQPVVSGEEAALARFTLPLTTMLTDATALAAMSPEGKALADVVRPVLDTFLDTLAVKGLPYSPDPTGDDEDEDWDALAAALDAESDDDELDDEYGEELDDEDDYVDPDDEAALAELADEESDDELDDDEDVVKLDPAELEADLAELEDDGDSDDEDAPPAL